MYDAFGLYATNLAVLPDITTSVVKSDAQEVIGSNIQVGAQTIFAEDIPDNPAQTLYLMMAPKLELVSQLPRLGWCLMVMMGLLRLSESRTISIL